eukprot:TRINITY_DN7166_c1_g2_i3.p3 TRINITY_DN7166_c1_g2~~TRINITY_DN7166_c1_g2_i3.p3  ORF type:complete len:150 (+),score=50.71 TRINITY_DN7166_c1_g2_i3:670-1119(+)
MQLIRAQAFGYKARKDEKLNNNQLLEVSVGFLSEYVGSNWIKLLRSSLEMDGEFIASSVSSKGSSSYGEDEDEGYRPAKYGINDDDDDFNSSKESGKKRKSSAADQPAAKKRRVRNHEKVDTKKNTKISSFFTQSPKKASSETPKTEDE